ncbi:MAG: SusE domain-containing protein [Bacteroidales bacterium]|nr:SusE domain-containing protein [Bacteroidales bacterium]
MKKNILIYISLIGIFGFFACEKEETRAILDPSPTAPTLADMPVTIVLDRDNATDTIIFAGNDANFGFDALVTYTLQADIEGNDFENAINISTNYSNNFEITVSNFNSKLLDLIKEDISSDIEIRVVAGVDGEIDDVYSDVYSVAITPYGLPRLDINIDGVTSQKIQSAAGDGKYVGFIKFEAGATFTMTDPDAGVTYGGNGTIISDGGPAITVVEAGWYKLEADINALTMNNGKYLVGIVGVVNGWGAPDIAMDYDVDGKFWYKDAIVMPDGGFKFRHNEDWGNEFNLGVDDNTNPDLTNLRNHGASQDIVLTAGTYDIKLWIAYDNGVVPEHGSSCTIEEVH